MRTRTIGMNRTQRDVVGEYIYYNGGTPTVTELLSNAYTRNYARCTDEVHPNHPESGGPLSIIRYSAHFDDVRMRTGYTGYKLNYGIVIDADRRVLPSNVVPVPLDGLSACKAKGAECWDRFKPKLSTVNLGQFLGEAKDLTSLFKIRTSQFKDLGSNYLNYQFGWKPFVNDLQDWLKSVRNYDQQAARLQKRNGKWQRRGGELFSTNSTTADQNVYVTPSNDLTVIEKYRQRTITDRCWFKGSFRYYIPGLTEGKWGKFRVNQKLWGLELTPSLVYELTPWSWLADWFGNVGSIVSNYTSITYDNMAAKYAYVMRHTKTTDTCYATIRGRFSEWGKPTTYETNRISSVITAETKCRAAASPYGFNLEMADFSDYQLSILTALGISKIP